MEWKSLNFHSYTNRNGEKMRKLYMAYANMENGNEKWRVNVLRHEDKETCRKAAAEYAARYTKGPLRVVNSGIHVFYEITRKEWDSIGNDYKGQSIRDPKRLCVMEGSIPGNHGKGGTTLLFEHDHFEVIS